MSNGIDKLATELQKTVLERDKNQKKGYDTEATVKKVDKDTGTVWVKIPGGVDETPAQLTINASEGDKVMVRVSGGRAFLIGNGSNPPTDDTVANVAIINAEEANLHAEIAYTAAEDATRNADIARDKADQATRDAATANEAAQNAVADAAIATTAANQAVTDAGTAKTAANEAKTQASAATTAANEAKNQAGEAKTAADEAKADAAKANTAANGAVTSLGIVQGVVDALETDMDEMQTHVAMMDAVGDIPAGLHVVPTSNGYFVVLSNDGMYVYDNESTLVATFGENIRFNSYRPQRIGGENAYIEYYDSNNDGKADSIRIVGANISSSTGIPTKVSELQNDSGYQTSSDVSATVTDATKNKADKSEIPTKVSELQNDSQYATTTELEDAVGANAKDLADYITENGQAMQELQDQIDGAIDTWYYAVDPTTANEPAKNWTTTKQKESHLRDLYFNTSNGHSFRWAKDGNTFKWIQIEDADAIKALADAAKAQDTADKKRRVFVTTPTPPYDIGDLWTGGSTGDIKRCKTPKTSSQSYAAGDWELASKYTDDSSLNSYKTEVSNTYSTKVELQQTEESLGAEISSVETSTKSYADGLIEDEVTNRNAAIQASADSITSTVSSTYATKSSVPTKVSQLTNDKNYATQTEAQGYADTAESNAKADTTNKLKSYSTTTQMNSVINQKAESIEAKVTAAEASAKEYSDGLIEQEVTDRNTAIQASADGITQSVSANYTKTVDLANTDAVKAAKKAGTDAQSSLNNYKTTNDAAVAAAKKAGTDAQADLDDYKDTNDAAVADAKKAGTDAQADLDAYKTTVQETYASKSSLTQTENSIKQEVASTYTTQTTFNNYKTTNDSAVAAAKKAGTDAQADLDSYKDTNDAAVNEVATELESVKTTYVKNSTFETTTDQIRGEVSSVETTTKAYTDGKISQEVSDRNSAITQKANEITTSVSSTYATKSSLKTTSDNLANYISSNDAALQTMQDQIDGAIETWFYTVDPTTSNEPAKNWNTTDLKNIHLGDLYYNTQTGHVFRWQLSGSTYSWTEIEDTDARKALADAAKAQTTANAKRRVFVAQPTTPYEVGDLWVQGSSGDIMRCATARASGNYTASDWVKASKYTDDSSLESFKTTYNTKMEQTDQAISLRATKTEVSTAKSEAISAAENYTNEQVSAAKAEIKVTTDGISSEVSKISSVKYLNTNYNAAFSTIKAWSAEGTDAGNWGTTDASNVRVGDTVYLKVHDSTNNVDRYIKIVVSSVSGNNLRGISHGYEDILPVDTIKSTINQSSDSVKIQAKHVEIDGAAIFSNSDFKSAADAAYDAKGAATTAENNAKAAIPTKVSQLTNDSKFQTDTQVTSTVEQINKETISRGEQLVTNGSGMMGDNTNFKNLTFDGSQSNGSPGSFTRTGNYAKIWTNEYFPVDPGKNYRFDLDMMSLNNTGRMYSMLVFFDVDKYSIEASHHMYYSGTLTTLTQDLKAGDTVVHLADASKYKTYGTGEHLRALTFWDYKNSFGYQYPPETYSRNHIWSAWTDDNSIDKTNNTITLATAYTGATKPAGTYVSQGCSGGAYKYAPLSYSKIPKDWTHYSCVFSGTDYSGNNLGRMFPPGTAYCKVGFLWNYNSADDQFWLTNVAVYEDYKTDIETALSKSSYKIVQSNYSQSYATIKGWAVEGKDIGDWTVTSTAGVLVGDTVAIVVTNSTDNVKMYVLVTVTQVKNSTVLRGISHGLLDAGNATDIAKSAKTVADAAAPKTSAVAEEQYIYISKASGTTSVSGNTTWVTEAGDKQNTWTTKRPTYDSSYPVLFVAKQKKVVSGTVTCTTPVKDDTTTIIDGGHITTGTIDSSRLNADTIKVNAANIQGTLVIGQLPSTVAETSDIPTKVSQLTNDSKFQTETQVSTAVNNEANARKATYATSSTAAGTQAKVAACSNFALYTGATITVGFTNANTHATPTLNVNSTGAKTIKNYTGAALTAAEYKWAAGAALTFVYDGSYWRMQDSGATESKAAAAASASTASTKASEAATSASTASTKASEAATSASTASSKATAAANSASTASTKASEAATSASTASSKATDAANSATAAANSATTASDKASEASDSASTASTKASEASDSATAAAGSASTASSKATAAANSASTASTKASEAATSASTASTKASEASTSASTASSKATAAANSASTASTKASEASTSASTASTKATAAANSATAAEAAKNVALDTVTVKDTRNDNQPPSWYISNYPKKRVQEFKSTTTLGLSGDTYCWLQTDVPWADSSGGYPKQIVEVNGKQYWRQGTAASTWSSWVDAYGTALESAKTATTYITAVDDDGIKVHAANNPGVNYSKIDADGLEVYKNSSSVAKFGVETRIGQEGASRVELSSNSISLITDTGAEALKSVTSGQTLERIWTIGTFNTDLTGNSANTITLDLSSVTNNNKFYINLDSRYDYTYSIGSNYTEQYSKSYAPAQVEFTKASSGTQSKTVSLLLASAMSAYGGGRVSSTASKNVTFSYNAATSVLTITPAAYPSIANATSGSGDYQKKVTNARSYLRVTTVAAQFTQNAPQTELYGRTFLELNSFDATDANIISFLGDLGWASECIV